MERIESTSMNLEKNNIEKLKELFPNCVTEGKIDFDMLREILGDEIDIAREKYQFTWNGKAQAIKIAQMPSTATLRPCKEKSKDWDTTENLYIEGDNLEVLKQLQKTYFGKIKMIYIDPPYNTGGDFVYKDDFKNSIENYKQQTQQTTKSNPETSGRYHTDWLNMMYPRLVLARNMLSEDGAIYISIDDNEFVNLKKICDEIFGDAAYIGCMPRVTKKSGKDHSNGIAKNHDYILIYAKNYLEINLNGVEVDDDDYPLRDEFYEIRGGYKLNQTLDYDSLWYNPAMDFPIQVDGYTYYPGGSKEGHDSRHSGRHKSKDWVWRWSKEKFDYGNKNGFVVIKDGQGRKRIYTKTYAKAKISNSKPYSIVYEDRKTPLSSIELVNNMYSNDNAKKEIAKIELDEFEFPKPTSLIKALIALSDPADVILDFFSGSATTADAVLQANSIDGLKRKFIMVQLPEPIATEQQNTICDLGEERIRRAGEQIRNEWIKEHKGEGLFADENNEFSVDIGFKVFKLDTSNIKAWNNVDVLNEDALGLYNKTFEDGRSKEDMLYEIMLKYGVFDMKTTEVSINGKQMYKVGSRFMLVCLEDNITTDDIKAICEKKPRVVVFKEEGFANDNDKINAEYNLKKAGVEEIKCI